MLALVRVSWGEFVTLVSLGSTNFQGIAVLIPSFVTFIVFFLSCLLCGCNTAGSITSVVCDGSSGECQCKSNVEGMNCDTCKNGFQLLQEENPFGCSAGMLAVFKLPILSF